MATAKWIGAGANVRQKDRITCTGTGDWVSTDAITFTIASVSCTITLGASSLFTDAQVATTIYQAWEGITLTDTACTLTGFTIADGGMKAIPQFSEFTATNDTAGRVDLLANGTGTIAGKPIVLTVTEAVTGDEAATESTFTTATSQYHANQADNWDANAVPGDGDTVVFDSGNVHCRYALDLGSILVAQFTKTKTYSGEIGVSRYNKDNTAKPYFEYRTPRYLTADGFTNADLETGEGPGSGRIYLDGGTVASTYNIFGKGTRVETGIPCVLIIGANNANVVRNLAGDVGVAFYPGEAATLATLVTGDGPNSQASTVCGAGVTFNSATVTINGGTLDTSSALATGVANGGVWQHRSGTITSLTVNKGARFQPMGAATVTTLDLNGGEFDCTKGTASFAITNAVTMSSGSRFIDPQGRTGNISVQLRDCKLADVFIDTQPGKTLTFS